MIRTRDALLLARTKLKARRIRLGILLVTMSIVFAGLVFIAEVATGTITSLKDFGREGFGSRYLVQATPLTYQQYDNTLLIDKVKPLQEQLIARKVASAKKLGLTYDPKTDTSLYYANQQVGPNPTDVQPILNMSPLATAALNAQNSAITGISYQEFDKRAAAAGAIKTYRSAQTSPMYSGGNGNGDIQVLQNGREDYSQTSLQQAPQGPPTGLKSIQSLGWNQMSDDLLLPFLLDGQTARPQNGKVPIVAPYSAAEQLLGLSKLPPTASTSDKLQRLAQVRSQIAGKQAELCYRNSDSSSLLQKAIQQQAEITANKTKKDYSPPPLLYNLPSVACGPVTIKSDKRTTEEKTADANQAKFDAEFGLAANPSQGIVNIQIVGIGPDIDGGGANISAGAILSGLFGSSIGFGWFSPTSAFTTGTLASQAQGGALVDRPINQQAYYAEFSSLIAAKEFIKSTDCYGTEPVQFNQQYSPNAQFAACIAKAKPFSVLPYGNNAGAIDDFQHTIWKFGRYVILAVIIVAVIVMMGTFGKVIADSRRETAVFRSLGASRFAVSQIYLTYTVLVGLIVASAALVIGTVAAIIVDQKLSPGLSVNAVLTYNARDVNKQFSIIGFDVWYLAAIVAMVLLTAVISALIPLAANMRRNPIRDMRDE